MSYQHDESRMTTREKAWNALHYHVGKECLEFSDNYRVAFAGSYKERQAYQQKASEGCCGRFDIRVTIDNQIWMIGCNYGH